MNDKKIMAIALVGIVTSLVIFTAYEMSYAKNCSGFPNYTEKSISNPEKYNSDPEKQLEIWKAELGNIWASGYYDEQKDTLHICKYRNIEP